MSTAAPSSEQYPSGGGRGHGTGRVDWERIRRTTDADIAAQIAADPDTAPDLGDIPVAEWRRAFRPPVPDVKRIRQQLGLSQAGFAQRFGFSVRTVQQWEQNRAVPDRPARILLTLIERAPDTVAQVLSTGPSERLG